MGTVVAAAGVAAVVAVTGDSALAAEAMAAATAGDLVPLRLFLTSSETQFLGIPSFHPLAIVINYHQVVIYGYDQFYFLFVCKLFCN